MTSKQLAVSLLALAVLWLLLIEAPVWLAAGYSCYTNYDFGIYSQAVALLDWHHPNPWLSGRQLRVFNDHFDPILWTAKIFELVWPAPQALLVTEVFFVLGAALPVWWLYQQKGLGPRAAFLLTALMWFNIGVTDAVHFPAHPTVWAACAWSCLVVAVWRGHAGAILAALVFLFACKEEFPFVGLVLACVFWQARRRYLAAAVCMLSAAWIGFVWGIRPQLLGPGSDYGAGLIGTFVSAPWQSLRASLTFPALYSRVGIGLLYTLPIALWAWRGRLRPIWGLWLILLPPLAIRFLGLAWRHQYMAPVMVGFALACLPWLMQREPPRWVIFCVLGLLIGSNSRNLRFAYDIATAGVTRALPFCPANQARLTAVAQAVDYLHKHPTGAAIVGGNLLASLVYRADIYGIGGPQGHQVYSYALVEKTPNGNAWPLKPADIDRLVAAWRQTPSIAILRDDDLLFFARGQFTEP